LSEAIIIQDPESGKQHQTVGEEIANSVSHGVGLVAALCGIPFLVARAARHGSAAFTVGTTIFAVTVVLLYLTSTLYHALPRGKAKKNFQLIEHISIYFLIAGTYTPFTLGVLRGPWGWTLFGLIWALAVAGVAFKYFGGVRYPVVSGTLYVLMGWVVVIAVRPLWFDMPHAGFFWIFLGGLAYTAGVIFFAIDYRMPYSHFIWHLFVLAGTTFHFFAVLLYAA
jgi:hemolysin III